MVYENSFTQPLKTIPALLSLQQELPKLLVFRLVDSVGCGHQKIATNSEPTHRKS